MSNDNGLVDVPIIWEEIVAAPEYEVGAVPVGVSVSEEVSSNVIPSEEESEEDMAEVTGFVMLDRRGMIARIAELKSQVRKLKKAKMALKDQSKEKIQELEEENEEFHIRNWWTNEEWKETARRLTEAEEQNKVLKEEVEKKEGVIARLMN